MTFHEKYLEQWHCNCKIVDSLSLDYTIHCLCVCLSTVILYLSERLCLLDRSRSRIRCSQVLYVLRPEKMCRPCNFCAVHVGSPKTGLLDSPDDLLAVKKKSRSIRPLVIEISSSKEAHSLQKEEISDMKVDIDGSAKIQNSIWSLPDGSNRSQTVRKWLQINFLGFPCCGGSHNSKNSWS